MPNKRVRRKKGSDGKIRVSQSKLKTWRRCHRAFHYKYVEKLRAIRKRRPLMFGSLIHTLLEAELSGVDYSEILGRIEDLNGSEFSAQAEEFGSLIDDVDDILHAYVSYWGSRGELLDPHIINGRYAEFEFEIEVVPGVIWNGKIDAIARTPKDGRTWMVDHKTFNRRPSLDDAWRSLQGNSYIHAIRVMGWPEPSGMLWDYIWSKPPAVPRLLNSGTLSCASIDTTPRVVKRALRKHKLKKAQYKGFLENVEKRMSDRFYRTTNPIHESVVDLTMESVEEGCRQIAEYGETWKDMNVDRHCQWCDYEPLCRAKMTGQDSEYVKETRFEVSDEKKSIPGSFDPETDL